MKIRSLLLVAATIAVVTAPLTVKFEDSEESVLPDISIEMNEAEAAGTGTETFGDLVVNYFTNGKTELKIVKGSQVLFYAVLTSAETTEFRKVYTSTPGLASGGQTAGTYDAVDDTNTLPGEPIYGDLTD